MKFQRKVRQLHKILGFVVVIQLLMWMTSGLYMTAVPIDIVRGEHVVEHQLSPLSNLIPELTVNEIVQRYPNALSIELFNRLDTPIYKVTLKGNNLYVHGNSGEVDSGIHQAAAERIALASLTESFEIVSTTLITKRIEAPETGGRELPLWRVQFDDWANTTFYISQNTARVSAVRSDIWRVFDFLWMLHIMDYDERSDFNNPLIILFASLGLFLTLSGLLMLFNAFNKQGFKRAFK